MKQKLVCEVVQDLLPLYIDRLTQPKTTELVQEHLAQCENCHKIYEEMTGDMPQEQEVFRRRDIDYLKKVRRNSWWLAAVCVAGVLAIVAAVVLGRLFVWGYPVQYIAEVQQQENVLHIKGMFPDSATVFSRYRVEEGKYGPQLVVYGCLPSLWNHNGGFEIEYELEQEPLVVEGDQYLPDGSIITQQAFTLYEAKNPYIGNAPANGKLAQILQTGTKVGPFLNQLYTSAEPYAWELQFKEELTDAQVEEMRRHACVLLAMIGNCGEIRWTYPQDGVQVEGSLSREQAKQLLGKEAADFAQSPQTVQQLLDELWPI